MHGISLQFLYGLFLNLMQNYEELAYENATVGNQVPCRIPANIVREGQPTILPIPTVDFPVITREQAVVAFKEYVSSKWCWEHKFLETLRVYDVQLFLFVNCRMKWHIATL